MLPSDHALPAGTPLAVQSCTFQGGRHTRSLLLDPTVLVALGLGASFWAGGQPTSLGPRVLPGAVSGTPLRKVTARERSRGGFPEDGA